MSPATTLESVMQLWAADSKKSNIKPIITRFGLHKLTFVEEFQSVDDAGNYYNSKQFDEIVSWATDNLKTWTTCRQTEQNCWLFSNHKDVEKFLTIYYLTWDR